MKRLNLFTTAMAFAIAATFIPAAAQRPPGLVGKKIQTDLWFPISSINSRIDMAVSYCSDTYATEILPSYIAGAKSGTQTDYIGSGITYAHSKGLKVILVLNLNKYTGGNREAIKTDTTAQNKFLSDIGWILQRYPTLDAVELEEPYFNATVTDGGAANRTFLNNLFTKAKNVVISYRSFTTFSWGFNCGSNSASNVALAGIDYNYISTYNLFNMYTIQSATESLSAFQSLVSTWQTRLPGCDIIPAAFLTWSSLANACKAQYPDWQSPTCWNRGVFDQVKWAHSVGQPVWIFTMGRLTQPASNWPNDNIPGTSAGAKLKYIWSGR